ncbi:MAG: glycosyltransferase [Butyrivibrio sp.]|jgi:glycosyltransferase involved in cell wall biosynthesis|nr:glycosyltransferase [Butyrivibrio sp.]
MVKISVLVPVYNVEMYLNKCLDSICKQTLREIEILCIDDGSTDSSKDILDSYAKCDRRISVIHKENTGYGNSMNIALQHASGKYIAIVESDDFIDEDMLENLYREAEQNQVDVIKSNFYEYFMKQGMETKKFNNYLYNLPVRSVIDPLAYTELFFSLQSIWSAIYKRDFLLSNKIRFNETPGASYQDVSFAFQVYACAHRIILVPEAYYFYRTDNMSSSVNSPDKVFCICDELNKIETFISQLNRGLAEKEYFRVLASRLGYRVLKENYTNLASPYQYALFCRMREYFQKYAEKGYIKDSTIWNDEARKDLQAVIQDGNAYFIRTAKAYADERVGRGFCINSDIYGKAISDMIIRSEHIVIYGAGVIGKEVLAYLLNHNVNRDKIIFAVTRMEENDADIEGISVVAAENIQKITEQVVVIAVREQLQFEIVSALKKRNIENLISVDQKVRMYITKHASEVNTKE